MFSKYALGDSPAEKAPTTGDFSEEAAEKFQQNMDWVLGGAALISFAIVIAAAVAG